MLPEAPFTALAQRNAGRCAQTALVEQRNAAVQKGTALSAQLSDLQDAHAALITSHGALEDERNKAQARTLHTQAFPSLPWPLSTANSPVEMISLEGMMLPCMSRTCLSAGFMI